LRSHSLRLRLILIWALAIVLSLTAAGVVLTALFAQHIESVAVRRLTVDLNRLAALIDADDPAIRLTQSMSDPRFEIPYGGIYWQVRDPASGQVGRSRSTWDQTLDTLGRPISANQPTELRLTDPEGAPAVAVARVLSFELASGGTRPLELVVAEDAKETDEAVAAYRLDMFRALLVLAGILVLAAWAQVTLGLAPLKAIRRGVSAIRAGNALRLEGAFPTEVQPLVAEVNDLTQAQELAIQFARERAADLAHGLKGNLQVLNAEAHELRLKGDEAAAEAIESLTREMARTIDHQLGLSRLRRRSPHRAAATDLGEGVERIVRTLHKTARGTELDWAVEIAPATAVSLDGPDLAELLGALIENATKWAKTRVRVSGLRQEGFSRLCVEDDGPGLSDAQIERLGQRGVRLDEARSGSGIGLSIVREIVALNGGELSFSRSALGGLCVLVRLPAGPPPL
jgi:signal transduction histidine kinase